MKIFPLINNIFAFFPAYCFLISAIFIIIFRKHGTHSYKYLLPVSILGTLEFFISGCYLVFNTYTPGLEHLLLFSQSTTMLVFPIFGMYITRMQERKLSVITILTFLPAVAMTIIALKGIILYKWYYIIFGLEAFITLLYAMHTMRLNNFRISQARKFFKDEIEVTQVNASCLLIMMLMAVGIVDIFMAQSYKGLLFILADVLHTLTGLLFIAIFYIGTMFESKLLKISYLTRPYLAVKKVHFSEQETENDLTSRLKRYIENEKHFTDPGITINSVAADLYTNRTYLSSAIHESLQKSFRQYINELRINEAKRILVEEPNEVLGKVAKRCGFASDSQFVKKFTEMEGIPPRLWQKKS